MKILVTGGAGYVGSVLVPILLDNGYDITVIDDFRYKQTSLLDVCERRKLQVYRRDVFSITPSILGEFDSIVHLACITGAPACDKNQSEAERINLDSVRYLLNQLQPHQQFIFPCTNSGYGIGQESIECDENTPLNPISFYGRLKIAAEKLVLQKGGISLRFATLFGPSPRMRLDLLVNDFVYRAVKDKVIVLFESHFKRNYVHVRDACKSILFALENYQEMEGQAFNVGLSDANYSKKELCEKIKIHIPELVIIESDIGKDKDKRNYIVSNAKIEKLGFKPFYTLHQGIEHLMKAYEIISKDEFTNL